MSSARSESSFKPSRDGVSALSIKDELQLLAGPLPVGQFPRVSVRNSLVTDNSPSPVASDRAIARSTLLLTMPVRVTRPCSTMMWIGGFAIAA